MCPHKSSFCRLCCLPWVLRGPVTQEASESHGKLQEGGHGEFENRPVPEGRPGRGAISAGSQCIGTVRGEVTMVSQVRACTGAGAFCFQ